MYINFVYIYKQIIMSSEKERIFYLVLSKFKNSDCFKNKANRFPKENNPKENNEYIFLEKIGRIIIEKMKNCKFSDTPSKFNKIKETMNASILFNIVLKETKHDLDLKEFLFMEMGNSPEHLVTDFKPQEKISMTYLLKNPQILQNIFYPENLIKNAQLTLDSKNRIRNVVTYEYLSYPSTYDIFSWNIAPINSSYDSSNTAVSTSLLKNIVSIKMKPFILPNLYAKKNINIEMLELNQQAYINQTSRFHFSFNASYTTQKTYAEATGYRSAYTEFPIGTINKYTQISLKEYGKNLSIYYFNEPIAELPRLSLKFSDDSVLNFDNDYITATIITGTRTGLVFPYIPNITLYDEVIISNLTADNANTNTIKAILDNINNQVFQITSITNTDTIGTNAIYYIDISSDGLTGINNGQFLVYLNSKRFIITLDIEYIPKYIL